MTATDKPEMRPCPFCGSNKNPSKRRITTGHGESEERATCDNCWASIPETWAGNKNCIEMWNEAWAHKEIDRLKTKLREAGIKDE